MPPPRSTPYDDRGRSSREREARERDRSMGPDRDWSPGHRHSSNERSTGRPKPSSKRSEQDRSPQSSSRESQDSSASGRRRNSPSARDIEERLERCIAQQESKVQSLISATVQAEMSEIKTLLATVAQQSQQMSVEMPSISAPSPKGSSGRRHKRSRRHSSSEREGAKTSRRSRKASSSDHGGDSSDSQMELRESRSVVRHIPVDQFRPTVSIADYRPPKPPVHERLTLAERQPSHSHRSLLSAFPPRPCPKARSHGNTKLGPSLKRRNKNRRPPKRLLLILSTIPETSSPPKRRTGLRTRASNTQRRHLPWRRSPRVTSRRRINQ